MMHETVKGFGAMSLKGIPIFLDVAGLVLSALGLFLPWGELLNLWPPTPFPIESNYVLGIARAIIWLIALPVGLFTFGGWLIAMFSWLPMVRGQEPSLTFVMSGAIMIMIGTYAWIAFPGALLFPFPPIPSSHYWVLYGPYVSFTGGALILIGATSTWLFRLRLMRHHKQLNSAPQR
jgi:hypothetical protein